MTTEELLRKLSRMPNTVTTARDIQLEEILEEIIKKLMELEKNDKKIHVNRRA